MWLSIVMMKSVLSKCASCRQSTSSSVQALVRQWKQKGRTPLFAHLLGKSQCWAFAWGINVWGTSSVEKCYVRLLSCMARRLLFFIQMKGCFMDYQIHFRWYVNHSLTVSPQHLPQGFVMTAWTQDDSQPVVMGMRNSSLMMEGVQFHPESFLTECGHQMLGNFIKAFASDRKVIA